MNYYYLIAGLPDIQPEETKAVPDMKELKSSLAEQFTADDRELLRLIFAKYDNLNLLRLLRDKNAQLDDAGNLSEEDWGELRVLMNENEKVQDKRLFPYIQKFYRDFNDENFSFNGSPHEDYLASLYYEYAMQTNNAFLHDWFAFNLNMNNILTAVTCRKHGYNPQNFIIGNAENEVAQTLRKSSARDFGLTGVFDLLDVTLSIADENNLLEREKRLDALRWNWLDEHTFFHYFSAERALAFVLKCELINRWRPLTQEHGTEVFRSMLEGLKRGVEIGDTV